MTKHHLLEVTSKTLMTVCGLALLAACGCGSGFNATSSAYTAPSASTTASPSSAAPAIETSPSSIAYGGAATLTWTGGAADTTLVQGGDVLAQDTRGSLTVMPTRSTTYAMYSTSASGTSLQTADVVVTAPASLITSSHADWLARAQATLTNMEDCGSGVVVQQSSESSAGAIERAGSSGSTCVVLAPVSPAVDAAEYVGNAVSSQGREIAYISDTPELRAAL